MRFRIAVILFLIPFLFSCEENSSRDDDFYDSEDRVGLWVCVERGDSLAFVNDSILNRTGNYYSYTAYLYRISDEVLFIRLGDESIETEHPILDAGSNEVILGNMFITNGFTNNSGRYVKQE